MYRQAKHYLPILVHIAKCKFYTEEIALQHLIIHNIFSNNNDSFSGTIAYDISDHFPIFHLINAKKNRQ